MAALITKQSDINSCGQFLNLMRHGSEKTQIFNDSAASFLPLRLVSEHSDVNKKLGIEKRQKHKALARTLTYSNYDHLDMSDSEIVNLANIKARNYNREYHHADLTPDYDWSAEYQKIEFTLLDYGIKPHPVSKNPTEKEHRSACLRLKNPLWWRRQLRAVKSRTTESERVKLGYVGRPLNQLYVSDATLNSRQYQRRRNARILEGLNAINTEGYEKDLLSLQNVTVSNPEIRRNELMARLKGLESYARKNKFSADFWTFTCPSAMHRYRSAHSSDNYSGFLNPAYNSFTPRDSQQYLNKQWQKIRATLKTQKIDFFGMRVAEPHHDGTPHWHLLLFIKKHHRTKARHIARRFMLQHSPDEKGAQKHRFTAKKLVHKTKDGKNHSPVGYVAKYIAKNLTPINSTTNLNNDGKPVHSTVDRVEAWASVWGIRQFQQLGGERVTVWRQLRRIRDFDGTHSDHFQPIYMASDSGDYEQFITESQKIEKVKILKNLCTITTEHIDRQTGEVSIHDHPENLNIYGELKQHSVIGLSSGNHFLFTKSTEWEIKTRRTKPLSALLRANVVRSSLDSCQ